MYEHSSIVTAHKMSTALQTPDALKQIGGPKLKWNAVFQGQYRDAMLWGTYRPGYYWGTRFRMPYTLSAGLMWFDPTHPDGVARLRHEARQEDGVFPVVLCGVGVVPSNVCKYLTYGTRALVDVMVGQHDSHRSTCVIQVSIGMGGWSTTASTMASKSCSTMATTSPPPGYVATQLPRVAS